MKLLSWLVVALVAVVLILFAVSNRETVSLALWPLPALVDLPLYLVILATLLVGFVAGELVAWIGGRHWRREAKRGRDRIAALERDLAAERAQHGERVPVAAISQ
jgi:uncharacterized integral membrane protein